ncbi:hypothetical protein GO491_11770 [Flavobacteriaceae bacterium Ap0902]|nr:hypothetical protein [Flavobacteriaceae bacterium Ap0902]
MLILDRTYFYGDIHLPNLDEKAVSLTQVDLLLSKWEKEAFTILLGVDLYDELQSHLIKSDGKVVVKEDSEQKWKDLWHGATFNGCKCGCKKRWKGFVSYDEVLYNGKTHFRKSSPIAYYAYFMHSLYSNTNTTGTGEQAPKTKNSKWLNNVRKRTSAWNRFVTEQRTLECFIKCNFCNYCGKHLDFKTTMGI